ncbi:MULTISPECIES: hypothetical protein [Mucilaginibacter]|uniref:hypothetical protein n=1 Tax=Mucilaginibacter TaxID=423349 RepID=UPI0008718738|nr:MULTISPECIES: hypothetical protein [Mucilaginibacter]NVM63015.1 hypothetical protein [Mucilaginibacter sp. SG538B]SCW42830.1 hypothetical protein SAMN03159284_00610 [Mucilaginibacter sp. NFR10]
MNVSFYTDEYQIYRVTKVKSTLNVLTSAGVVAVKALLFLLIALFMSPSFRL